MREVGEEERGKRRMRDRRGEGRDGREEEGNMVKQEVRRKSIIYMVTTDAVHLKLFHIHTHTYKVLVVEEGV